MCDLNNQTRVFVVLLFCVFSVLKVRINWSVLVKRLKMNKCVRCSEPLPQENDYAVCNSCNKGLHYICAGVRESTWRKSSVEYRQAWKCISCKPKNVADKTLSQINSQVQ